MARKKTTPSKFTVKVLDGKSKKDEVVAEKEKEKGSGSKVKHATTKHKSRVGREIKEQQNSTGFALKKLPFNRLAREIGDEYAMDGIRWSKVAFDVLQTAAERHIVEVFGNSNYIRLAANAKRQSIKPDDIWAAIRVDSRNTGVYFSNIVTKSGEVFLRDKSSKDPVRRKIEGRLTYWNAQVERKKMDLELINAEENREDAKKQKAEPKKAPKKKADDGKEEELQKKSKRKNDQVEEEQEEEEDKSKKQKRKGNI